jgi:hypothetical protein
MYLPIGIAFNIIGLGFGFTGILTNLKLKHFFGEFYYENRWKILLATYGLSLPMLLRGSFNIS